MKHRDVAENQCIIAPRNQDPYMMAEIENTRSIRRAVLPACILFLVWAGNAAAASGFFTTSDNVRLHYIVEGKGPTIVFVPGWIMPADIWAAQLQYFSKHFQVVALDPRSQGESQIASSGHDPKRRARDISELINALDLHDVVLVGWSLGVLETLAYINFFGDERLAALVWVDNSIGEDPPPQPTNFLQEYRAHRDEAVERFVRGMFRQPRPESYYRQLTQMALRTPSEAAIALLTNLYAREFWREAAYKTEKPVLYAVTPRFEEQARNFKHNRPQAWTETFRDAGHALFVDDADRFNALLKKFLDQNVSTGNP